jgi:hypothetical protein
MILGLYSTKRATRRVMFGQLMTIVVWWGIFEKKIGNYKNWIFLIKINYLIGKKVSYRGQNDTWFVEHERVYNVVHVWSIDEDYCLVGNFSKDLNIMKVLLIF